MNVPRYYFNTCDNLFRKYIIDTIWYCSLVFSTYCPKTLSGGTRSGVKLFSSLKVLARRWPPREKAYKTKFPSGLSCLPLKDGVCSTGEFVYRETWSTPMQTNKGYWMSCSSLLFLFNVACVLPRSCSPRTEGVPTCGADDQRLPGLSFVLRPTICIRDISECGSICQDASGQPQSQTRRVFERTSIVSCFG